MKTVNMHEAKTHLSRLVAAAARGEPFVIARAGKPLVKVLPVEEVPDVSKRIGFAKGQFTVPDDINAYDDEVLRMFGLADE